MKLSVQPERETDDEYENEADDDFRPSSQQPSQPAHHGLDENPFDEDEDAFISDYQSDSKPSKRHTSLEEKRIDLEMLKKKNQNLELRHAMKHARTFLVLKNYLYPHDLDRSSGLKKKRSIITQTIRTSVLFAIRSKMVWNAGPPTKDIKKISGYLLLRKLITRITTGWKWTPPKTGLLSKIFWIDF